MIFSAIGLVLNMLGTFFVGFISVRGIPNSGDPIRAPKKGMAYVGWGIVFLGFLFQLIGLFVN